MKMKLSEYTARQSWLKGTTPRERALMLAAILAFHAALGVWWMNVEGAEASAPERKEYVTYYDIAVFESVVGMGAAAEEPKLTTAAERDSAAAAAAAAAPAR